MGRLVKSHLAATALAGAAPGSVFHCTIMPCYDKKLEAAREEFLVPGTQVRHSLFLLKFFAHCALLKD
jgi:iron only hydrogenase large subunit-like protein